jgi:ribosome-associated protein
VVVISAQRFRTQERNRDDARARLVALIAAASIEPKKRVATKPTRASRERRLVGKKVRADLKRGRSKGWSRDG